MYWSMILALRAGQPSGSAFESHVGRVTVWWEDICSGRQENTPVRKKETKENATLAVVRVVL